MGCRLSKFMSPINPLILGLWLMVFGFPLFGQKIVSLAPSLTEITCDLGLCDHLVGVTEYCLFPEQVKALPKVGGYINPSIEVILTLQPDLVLALPEHQDTVLKLQRLGIRVETIRNWSIEDIFQSIATVGRHIGRERQAVALAARLTARMKGLSKERPEPPRCLLVLGHGMENSWIREVYIVGRNGFLNEIIELAGGINAYPSDRPHFPKLDQEALLRLEPDIIIELVPKNELKTELALRKQSAWGSLRQLRAVREGQYHLIHADHILQAGPRFLQTLAEISALLDRL